MEENYSVDLGNLDLSEWWIYSSFSTSFSLEVFARSLTPYLLDLQRVPSEVPRAEVGSRRRNRRIRCKSERLFARLYVCYSPFPPPLADNIWALDVLYTLSGLPGSILGAYLVETSFGRTLTLAYSTLATSFGTFIFVFVTGETGVILSSMLVSLAATLMCQFHLHSVSPNSSS